MRHTISLLATLAVSPNALADTWTPTLIPTVPVSVDPGEAIPPTLTFTLNANGTISGYANSPNGYTFFDVLFNTPTQGFYNLSYPEYEFSSPRMQGPAAGGSGLSGSLNDGWVNSSGPLTTASWTIGDPGTFTSVSQLLTPNANGYVLFVSTMPWDGGQYADFVAASGTITGSPLPAVPEPETYAMLIAGLSLIGFAARRRKTA
jgi:hypothetical protein